MDNPESSESGFDHNGTTENFCTKQFWRYAFFVRSGPVRSSEVVQADLMEFSAASRKLKEVSTVVAQC